MNKFPKLPVVIIGAGPVGLAAAAHLVERGVTPIVIERGPLVGTALRSWGHVRLFSPWEYNIDRISRSLLESVGWSAPNAKVLPTGREMVRRYLEPLAAHPKIAPHVVTHAAVSGISRHGLNKVASANRRQAPFIVRWRDGFGKHCETTARAVIDASGTWDQPNPMGIDGLPVSGEKAAATARIAYGIPDVLGAERSFYAGQRVLVVGGGHSAINVALDLLRLEQTAPSTEVLWALRGNRIDKLFGGGSNDALPERGALGLAAKRAVEDGRVKLLAPFAATEVELMQTSIRVSALITGSAATLDVGRIVVATGFRPDLSILRELRVALDPAIEAPPALAPLIDPNVHSCGTVPPHGAAELAHPEPDFYIIGSKSYGRAPTFLMVTGYEQVRSVVAEIVGDHAAAREVHLVLPQTGVCSAAPALVSAPAAACCGEPALAETDRRSPAAKDSEEHSTDHANTSPCCGVPA
jgi:hypothetical protein